MCTVSPQQNLCFESFSMFIHANLESKRLQVRVCESVLVRFSYLFVYLLIFLSRTYAFSHPFFIGECERERARENESGGEREGGRGRERSQLINEYLNKQLRG